jgi:hypothetical protein
MGVRRVSRGDRAPRRKNGRKAGGISAAEEMQGHPPTPAHQFPQDSAGENPAHRARPPNRGRRAVPGRRGLPARLSRASCPTSATATTHKPDDPAGAHLHLRASDRRSAAESPCRWACRITGRTGRRPARARGWPIRSLRPRIRHSRPASRLDPSACHRACTRGRTRYAATPGHRNGPPTKGGPSQIPSHVGSMAGTLLRGSRPGPAAALRAW